MHRAVAVIASCLLGGALLTGCGEAETNPAPHEAPSASPSPTVSPAPTMPAEAKKHSKAGAIAFVRHFVGITNHALESGDFSEWQRLVSTNCESCALFHKNVLDIYDAGGSVKGGLLAPTQVVLAPGGLRPDGATVDVVATLNAQTVTRPNKPIQKGQPDKTFITYILGFDADAGWSVQSYTRGD